jgi:tetratricopeptide (TPR) repeat protein
MSEMLANRYFLSGRCAEAAAEFEKLLKTHPPRVAVKRRLVICYTMTSRLRDALELAADIMREDPDAAAQGDPQIDGFSCKQARNQLRERAKDLTPGAYHTSLGLLQLFCDEQKALDELVQALELVPRFHEVHRLKTLVKRHLEAGHV